MALDIGGTGPLSSNSRLEGTDHDGRSLAMLNRTAAALSQRVEIRLGPRNRGLAAARNQNSRSVIRRGAE